MELVERPLGPEVQASGPIGMVIPPGVTRRCWCGGTT
jgi:hypothetical protein